MVLTSLPPLQYYCQMETRNKKRYDWLSYHYLRYM